VNTKRTIRKILFVTMWLAIGSGMLTLLIAAMGKQKKELCKDYSITINGVRADEFFLDEAAIADLLKGAAHGNIKGQPRFSFNLQQMEQLLENNVWIKDAQLYFDNQAVLHISVEEREPVARIFTAGGRSFYIDENKQSLPLSENTIAKVPVFTGFPDKRIWTKEDSILLQGITTTAQYINSHPFWTSQVAQVDIVNCGPDCWEFEMIPVVGRHLIKMGNGENIAQKFRRLFAFYQQVLSRTGLDHYKTIDVRFAGQVIGAKSDNPRIDSVQVRKNVEELLAQAGQLSGNDTLAGDRITTGATDETGTPGIDNRAMNAVPKPVEGRRDDPPAQTRRAGNDGTRPPKAVMPRRGE
jgi:cell division protein FtsQ